MLTFVPVKSTNPKQKLITVFKDSVAIGCITNLSHYDSNFHFTERPTEDYHDSIAVDWRFFLYLPTGDKQLNFRMLNKVDNPRLIEFKSILIENEKVIDDELSKKYYFIKAEFNSGKNTFLSIDEYGYLKLSRLPHYFEGDKIHDETYYLSWESIRDKEFSRIREVSISSVLTKLYLYEFDSSTYDNPTLIDSNDYNL